MKKILITGGAGFIGTNLAEELLNAKDYDIVVVDNECMGKLARLAPQIKCVKADILDQETMRSVLQGVELVVHLAADTQVIKSIAEPVKNFDVNVVGTFNLLRLSYEAGVSTFVNASTGGAILGEAASPISEDTPAKPLSPYGASKLAAEGYCSAFSGAYGMRTLSLRFSNVYGPGSFHKNSVVAHFFKQILTNKELIVYGDGSQIRDYLYVGDLVKGIHAVMQTSLSGVYQLGSGRPTTLNRLIETIRNTIHPQQFKVRYEPYRRGEIHTTYCNIDKARNEFQFDPTTQLAQGIANCWEWFQKIRSFENAYI